MDETSRQRKTMTKVGKGGTLFKNQQIQVLLKLEYIWGIMERRLERDHIEKDTKEGRRFLLSVSSGDSRFLTLGEGWGVG